MPLLLLSKPNPLSLGFGLGPPCGRLFFISDRNIDFDRPLHKETPAGRLVFLLEFLNMLNCWRSAWMPDRLAGQGFGIRNVCSPCASSVTVPAGKRMTMFPSSSREKSVVSSRGT
jgi:hypothetical protein